MREYRDERVPYTIATDAPRRWADRALASKEHRPLGTRSAVLRDIILPGE